LQAELGEGTLRRCVKAVELYRQGKACPVLVSGGKVNPDDPGPTCTEAVRDFLIRVGVKADDVILEGRSRDTYENAVESCKLLRERGCGKPSSPPTPLNCTGLWRAFASRGSRRCPAAAVTGRWP
jgi:hypothetical protein